MHFSDELQIIWLTPLRTGTRSTIYLLKEIGFEIGMHELEIPNDKKNYTIICNVRNPYSRLVSIFFLQSLHLKDFKRDFNSWVFNSFEDKHFLENYQIEFHKFLSKVDIYIKIEKFIDSICSLPFINPNKSIIEKTIQENIITNHYENEFSQFVNRKDWKEYYNEDTANFVFNKLENQFKLFEYEKNSWNGTS